MRWKRFTRVFCGNKTVYETGVWEKRKTVYTRPIYFITLLNCVRVYRTKYNVRFKLFENLKTTETKTI